VTEAHTSQNYINSHWDSAASDPQWIMVDLGAAKAVNRVILKWNANAAKEFKIQTSTDGTAWTDVFSTTKGASYSVTDETFPATTARYVRMYGTARAPVISTGRGTGGGTGRGASGRNPQTGAVPVTQTNTQPITPNTPAAEPVGYSLFDFEVLKD